MLAEIILPQDDGALQAQIRRGEGRENMTTLYRPTGMGHTRAFVEYALESIFVMRDGGAHDFLVLREEVLDMLCICNSLATLPRPYENTRRGGEMTGGILIVPHPNMGLPGMGVLSLVAVDISI